MDTAKLFRHDPVSVCDNPHYIHVENDFVPWSRVNKPLSESRFALVTMGGLHLPEQDPFVDINHWGDDSFRELPRTLKTGDYRIAHKNYDHARVLADMNVQLPLDIFKQLEAERVIGNLADSHYAFSGSIPDPVRLMADTAPEVARRMRENEIDICILTST